ncbi:MAG: serine acetyltransferase [Deltaproteobacteria bacterium]|nr:serine acetyltransferase [Deltaproteobacteria bacterium]
MDEFVEKIWLSWQSFTERLPRISDGKSFVEKVLGLLFPQHSAKTLGSAEAVKAEIDSLREFLLQLLRPFGRQLLDSPEATAERFIDNLPEIHSKLWNDAEAILLGDPAACSVDEVVVAYPGFYAIAVYRISHEFYKMRVPILPRIFTEHAHQITGIDIHPGATIGSYFCIDHGTGIVVGETTIIHDHVKLYQGVTLGALSVDKKLANKKRHPTIESNVVIYSNATILGGETVIGEGSVIGGNVWITASVAPNSMVYHHSEPKVKNLQRSKN